MTGEEPTYVELTRPAADQLAEAFVADLSRRGVPRSAMVAFSCGNSPELLAAIFGCLRAGYAPVVLSPTLTDAERDDMLRDLPLRLVVDDELCRTMAHTPPTTGLPSASQLSATMHCRPLHFTSGTSGRPKAVWSGWLDEDAATALFGEEDALWHFQATDRHLVSAPLNHSAPLRFALNTLLAGGTVLLQRRFEPAVASALIETGGVTTAFMAPAHLQRLLAADAPARHGLRWLAFAGSPCPPRVRHRAVEVFGGEVLTEFYGSTEGQFTVCSQAEWEAHPGTVGRARPGRALRIVDEQIWCRAPSYARFEYWGDPDKTAAAWDGDWFTVGDLGRLDDDGYLRLDGRRTDLIITGGVNVYPAEIERVLGEIPTVEKICVVGVDDPQWGARVCAVVTGDADEEGIRSYAATHLAPYKRPKTILVVPELPMTHSGKVDRLRVAGLIDPAAG